ncbi:hypothetical protein CE195_06005, partial [Sodalis-like symbiont of Philaenus spumarius]
KRDVNERGRSMDSVIEQYQRTVRPMIAFFVRFAWEWAVKNALPDCPTARYAGPYLPRTL